MSDTPTLARPNGRPVILLHGWPYDIHSFVDVVPLLASAGYRVIVPYLRGYGTTSFLSSDTFRNGQQAALALDVIALMDALGIEQGSRRRLRLGRTDGKYHGGALAGALHGNRRRQRLSDCQSRGEPPAADAAGRAATGGTSTYFATERGERGYSEIPSRLQQAHLEARVADNGNSIRRRSTAPPDRSTTRITSDIVIHNYRWRLELGARRAAVQTRSKRRSPTAPAISVPAVTTPGRRRRRPAPGQPPLRARSSQVRYAHRVVTG